MDKTVSNHRPPCISPAAAAITFTLLGAEFHPVFTHQIFCNDNISWFNSISIRIELMPSGQECLLSIECDTDKEPASKRMKAKEESESIELGDTDTDTDEDDDCEDDKKRLTPREMESLIKRFLPSAFDPSTRLEKSNLEYLSSPIGQVHTEYVTGGQRFCISICRGKLCAEYHSAVQKLAYFFIESAEEVDVAQDDSWKCLYLFQKHQENRFSLAGYITVYHFNSPFRRPVPGIVARVCQALVLPPYQRSGHGKAMLHAVFDTAESSVVEVNCEDPAPSFASVRTVVDFERFQKQGSNLFDINNRPIIEEDASFLPLKDASAQQLTAKALTTAKQIQLVYELDVLSRLQAYFSDHECPNLEELEKKYRLMVKKRLNRQNHSRLSSCADKAERQKLLEELFEAVYQRHSEILKRTRVK